MIDDKEKNKNDDNPFVNVPLTHSLKIDEDSNQKETNKDHEEYYGR